MQTPRYDPRIGGKSCTLQRGKSLDRVATCTEEEKWRIDGYRVNSRGRQFFSGMVLSFRLLVRRAGIRNLTSVNGIHSRVAGKVARRPKYALINYETKQRN